jgi:HD superfamily phosphodiesterase
MTPATDTPEIRIEKSLIARMKSVFGDDSARIDHAMKVLGYAESIMDSSPGVCSLVVRAAAILHDIGIHAAEQKHGNSSGRYQEIEGPPIAREILESMSIDERTVDHVCRIVANHHSARDIDTPEFRIIWDADWLVNIPDEYDTSDSKRMSELINKVFKTQTGRTIAQKLFLGKD